MIKANRTLIVSIAFLLLLAGAELTSHYLYYESSRGEDQLCYEHNKQDLKDASDLCGHISSASNSAFSWATQTHTLMNLMVYLVFLGLGRRIDKLERQLEESKGSS